MADKIKLKNKLFGKNPFVGTTLSPKVKLPVIRVPRGPTVRWSIDYNKLFKKKK